MQSSKKLLMFLGFFYLLLVANSCTQSPPSIIQFHVTTFWLEQDGTLQPSHLFLELGLAIPPSFEDVRTIIVRNPGRALSWQVEVGDIIASQQSGRAHLILPPLGYDPLGYLPARPIPFGLYEIEVINLDGQTDLVSFTFARSMQQELFQRYESKRDHWTRREQVEIVETGFGKIEVLMLDDQFWIYRER
jgi:hypothetical protein